MDRFTVIFALVTCIASVTGAASATIITYMALSTLAPSTLSGLAVGASAVQIFAVLSLIVATAVFLRRASDGIKLVTWVTGAASCLAATTLGLTVFGKALHLLNNGWLDGNDAVDRLLAIAGLSCSAVSLTVQIIFYALIRPYFLPELPEVSAQSQGETPSPMSGKRRSITIHLSALSPASPKFMCPGSDPSSPSFSAFSSSPRSSIRGTIRPMTSKTRLLLGTSLASRDSRSVHSAEPIPEAARSNDDFRDWDTSAIQDAYDQPFASRTRVTKLETIPGSRPVSPAHPLGEYLRSSPTKTIPRSESPVRPAVTSASAPSASNSSQHLPRTRTRRSSSTDQAHIHPLFRSESPAPPPLVSPGTVITASPYAGQIVSPEELGPRLLASPNGSRPSTPTLPIPPARSHPASIKSFRVASPAFAVDDGEDAPASTSGSNPNLPLRSND